MDEAVVEHDVGELEQTSSPHRDQIGISRPGSHEVHRASAQSLDHRG